jgi:glycosidase
MTKSAWTSPLHRLKQSLLESVFDDPRSDEAQVFLGRTDDHAPGAIRLLDSLYGEAEKDFDACLLTLFKTAAEAYRARPEELKALDTRREDNPAWYQSNEMMGAFCYVDLFAGDLKGLRERIPYFKELGLTYLHLMPLFKTPPGPNDGGYAVSTYREVNPALGTMDDLIALAADLRGGGISLVLDFVFNHTASDHEWAERAKRGEESFKDYYFLYDGRTIPDQYEPMLREIFPEEHPGAFTFHEDAGPDGKWVWTTFHDYQWDLNYRNPAVFRQMLEEMLFLANVGVEVLRLDAVAFIWKEVGSTCENLPQAHTLIQAFNALVRIAAPGMIFKSEAIVHPDDVVKYFGTGDMAGKEAEIGYNPLLMVELWEALATGHTHLLTGSMKDRFTQIPEQCAWVNYVRSHDDIGWGFANEDAEALQINPFWHRQYLNRFYTGEEHWSFAKGYPFQYNPITKDTRISGTTASLAGLEYALANADNWAVELAIRRVLLIHSVILSMGGLPLLSLGDEIATLNDYRYLEDPDKKDDSRWVHRRPMDWKRAGDRFDPGSVPGRVFQTLQQLIGIRKVHPAFGANAANTVIETGNSHLYAYAQELWPQTVVCLTNFTPHEQITPAAALPMLEAGGMYRELVTNRIIKGGIDLTLPPYGFMWIGLHAREE